jgi:hypothetical protein
MLRVAQNKVGQERLFGEAEAPLQRNASIVFPHYYLASGNPLKTGRGGPYRGRDHIRVLNKYSILL